MIPIPAKQRRKTGCGRFLILISALFLLFTAAVAVLPLLDARHRVVIDPGHGGHDIGAAGVIEEIALTETTAGKLAACWKQTAASPFSSPVSPAVPPPSPTAAAPQKSTAPT